MTCLPSSTDKKLGLVIDLDTCVGCHACVVSCKGWNTENYGAPLADQDAYGENPLGTFLNRVHSYEVQPEDSPAQLIHFPKSCLHCDDAPCVTVCPTGASYKRTEDGIRDSVASRGLGDVYKRQSSQCRHDFGKWINCAGLSSGCTSYECTRFRNVPSGFSP